MKCYISFENRVPSNIDRYFRANWDYFHQCVEACMSEKACIGLHRGFEGADLALKVLSVKFGMVLAVLKSAHVSGLQPAAP